MESSYLATTSDISKARALAVEPIQFENSSSYAHKSLLTHVTLLPTKEELNQLLKQSHTHILTQDD